MVLSSQTFASRLPTKKNGLPKEENGASSLIASGHLNLLKQLAKPSGSNLPLFDKEKSFH